ncbi:MAG: hypothetical protein NUW37_09410 [Planctomycetes bacterium]|nr:hypothetical protein [Planctomycetota bacterium]
MTRITLALVFVVILIAQPYAFADEFELFPRSEALKNLLDRPEPDFDKVADVYEHKEEWVTLPLFVVPQRDIDTGNELVCVFVNVESQARVQYSACFRDEDHPLTDEQYDAVRWHRYKRIADVESFYIEYVDGKPAAIDFPGVYAADQTFYVLAARHNTIRLGFSEFETEDSRPIVHVNTWNHMFSDKDNGKRDHVYEDRYATYVGGREDLEKFYSDVYEDYESSSG